MLLVAIGIILTCFTTAGAVIDRILVGRHRSALHLAMVRWWSMIDDVKVPAFPALAARRVLHLGKRIFRWRLLSWQSLVICIALSWCVTSAAQLIACILDGEPWSILPHHLPIFSVYFANFPYDLATVFVTVRILQILSKSPRFFPALSLITLNVVTAGILAVGCFASIYEAASAADRYNWPGAVWAREDAARTRQHRLEQAYGPGYKVKEINIDLPGPSVWEVLTKAPGMMWEQLRSGNPKTGDVFPVTVTPLEHGQQPPVNFKILTLPATGRWAPTLISLSTFLPTVAYMLVLAVLLLAKIVLTASRAVVLYTLERLTEHDPAREPKEFMLFTLLGTVFGTAISVTKAIAAMFH